MYPQENVVLGQNHFRFFHNSSDGGCRSASLFCRCSKNGEDYLEIRFRRRVHKKNNKNLEKAKPEIEKLEKELVLRALRKNCLQTDAHALFFSLSISPCAFHTLVLCTLACAHTHNHTNIKTYANTNYHTNSYINKHISIS